MRDGVVEIAVRDSTVVAELFELRPVSAVLVYELPGMSRIRIDSVAVEYVAPQIAQPSDSLRAWAANQRRLALKNARSVTRFIQIGGSWSGWDTSWVSLGDTLNIRVSEMVCSGDLCSTSWSAPRSDSSFVVGDTTVLGTLSEQPRVPRRTSPGVVTLSEESIVARGVPGPIRRIAKRPGISTVHIAGLEPYADTASVREAPPLALTRVVVVRPPAARVVIHPRPDTLRAGEEPRFTADVFDAGGGLLVHTSVTITYPDAETRPHRRPGEPLVDWLPAGGYRRVVAAYRGKADTLTVFVADTVRR